MGKLRVSDVPPAERARLVRYFMMAMRQSDYDEIVALTGSPALVCEELRDTIENSPMCWVAREETGRPVLLGGAFCQNFLSDMAAPWMIASLWADAYPGELTRIAARQIDRIRAAYPVLQNWVWAHNEPSKRWLARLGFTLYDAEPLGATGEPFHRFTMGA